MKIDKSLISGSTTMLILRLLEKEDMYGYQMIEELELRSENIFTLKAGTLYPILHTLEQQSMIQSYEQTQNGRSRKYYRITDQGAELLQEKKKQWITYSASVSKVLGGTDYAILQ
jgi:PadR family transcriptional regulator PadR